MKTTILRLVYAIALCPLALALGGCNDSSSSDPTAANAPSQKAVKASGEDCPTFARELQAACSDVVAKRLNFSCNTYLMQLEMAQQQAGGKLFDVGDDGQNQKVAATLCSKSLTKLRAARAKAEESPVDETPWAEDCGDYFATLKEECFSRIGNGTHAEHCQQTIQMVQAAARDKNDGAMACTMGALYFPAKN